MKVRRPHSSAQRGVAMLTAIIIVFILSVLAASLLMVTTTEVWATNNHRELAQARYAAEAGAQRTANFLIYPATYTPPTVTPGFPPTINGGFYDITQTPVVCILGCPTIGKPVVLSADGTPGNYPVAATQTAFNAALSNQAVPGMPNTVTYSTHATLLAMKPIDLVQGAAVLQTWQITSTGSIAGVRNASVPVIETIEKFAVPVFNYAVYSTGTTCNSLVLGGGGTTNSYDSGLGTYAQTAQQSGGNVGTNGNLSIQGSNTTVNGTFSDPNRNANNQVSTGACGNPVTGFTNSGSATDITGPPGCVGSPSYPNCAMTLLSAPQTFPNPIPPSPVPPTTDQGIAGVCPAGMIGCANGGANIVNLSPGQYGNIYISGQSVVHLTAGTYNVNSLIMSGANAQIIVDSGPVNINIQGAGNYYSSNSAFDTNNHPVLSLTGNSLTNTTQTPEDLVFTYGGTAGVQLAGGSGAFGLVYAPNSAISTSSNNGDWYGAVVGRTSNMSGGLSFHYDRALSRNDWKLTNYYITSFVWPKN